MSAVEVESITYRYGDRRALDGVSFQVQEGEVFALLGPNGSGKTTLFRILSTLYSPTAGTARIFGFDVRKEPAEVRKRTGIVFQSPSLDPKLTVNENLTHYGRLYGLRGASLRDRIQEMMDRLHVSDRADQLVETLSGGLARRVELAKCFLHKPGLLILDEPSVGLDPGARHDLWTYLEELRQTDGTTVLVTTHLVDEGDRASRVLVLHEGKIVALDTPAALKDAIGGDVISLVTSEPVELSRHLTERFGLEPVVFDSSVRFERKGGHSFVAQLFESCPGMIQSVTVSRPTLEDVFIRRTGHKLWGNEG